MKIKIYQINMDRDNGSYSFTNYENTIRRTGGGNVLRTFVDVQHKTDAVSGAVSVVFAFVPQFPAADRV